MDNTYTIIYHATTHKLIALVKGCINEAMFVEKIRTDKRYVNFKYTTGDINGTMIWGLTINANLFDAIEKIQSER